MASYITIKSSIKDVETLQELTSFLKHLGGNELGRNFLKLIMRNANVVIGNYICSFGRKTSLKIK
jgi:hypothetical protein